MFIGTRKLTAILKNVMVEKTDLSSKECDELAFHLTDWLNDLEKLCDIYKNADKRSAEEVHAAVLQFLLHAPAHIVAASELLTGMPFEHIFREEPSD